MPELPEVETVRAGIQAHAGGYLITGVEVSAPRVIRTQAGGGAGLAGLLEGRTIASAHRRGKFMWLRLADQGQPEDHALMIHLGMSGQVLIKEPHAAPHRHLRVRFTLLGPSGEEREMWYVDQRMFGFLATAPLTDDPHGSGLIPAPMTHIGPDLLEAALAPGNPQRTSLNRRIRRSNRGIKTILLDQGFTAGIGNIYADEALWRTRLHYARPASRLRAARVEDVLDAATDVLREALAAGGTSFDELYVNVEGEQGYFERSLAVYGREGQPCHRCERLIVRENFQNRSSFRCPSCQRRPRQAIE